VLSANCANGHLLGAPPSNITLEPALSWPLDLLHAFILPTPFQRAHLPSDVVVSTARQRVVACARAACPLFCELSPRRRPPWAILNTNTRDDQPGTRPLSCRPEPYALPRLRHHLYITCPSPALRHWRCWVATAHHRTPRGPPVPDAPLSPHLSRTA
jgi:hypothetical protein